MKFFIYALVTLGVLSIVIVYVIGFRAFDGVVNESPYETGIRWDETQRFLKESGLEIEINNKEGLVTGSNDVKFTVQGSASEDFTLLLTRPSTNKYDKAITCSKIANNEYVCNIDFILPGHWDLVFCFNYKGRELSINKKIYIEKELNG